MLSLLLQSVFYDIVNLSDRKTQEQIQTGKEKIDDRMRKYTLLYERKVVFAGSISIHTGNTRVMGSWDTSCGNS